MTLEQATAAYVLICSIWLCFRLRTIFNLNYEITLKDFIFNVIFIFIPGVNIVFIFILMLDEDLFGDVVLFKKRPESEEDL